VTESDQPISQLIYLAAFPSFMVSSHLPCLVVVSLPLRVFINVQLKRASVLIETELNTQMRLGILSIFVTGSSYL
jgi:hypothetical protein